MEGNHDAKDASARRPSQSEESKKSYSQAASSPSSPSFYRKLDYSVGVVQNIHHHATGAYARFAVRREEEYSVKLKPGSDLQPGTLVRVTYDLANHEATPCIHSVHPDPVDDDRHPLVEGIVRYFDKVRKVWKVKVRYSKKLLDASPSRAVLLREQTILFIPSFPDGTIHIKKIVECNGGIPEDTPDVDDPRRVPCTPSSRLL